jgi:hypothetical protein
MLSDPAYSPDIVLSDYQLFELIERFLQRKNLKKNKHLRKWLGSHFPPYLMCATAMGAASYQEDRRRSWLTIEIISMIKVASGCFLLIKFWSEKNEKTFSPT